MCEIIQPYIFFLSVFIAILWEEIRVIDSSIFQMKVGVHGSMVSLYIVMKLTINQDWERTKALTIEPLWH